MPEKTREANALKSTVRSKIEHVFAHQKGPMAAFVRTIGQLWEKKSDGKGLFLIVEKENSGQDMRAQLKRKIGG